MTEMAQALGEAGSAGPAKLSGKPAVSVSAGGPSGCFFTMTRNEQEALWPQMLVAVQVTTLVPSGKTVPEGGVQRTGPTCPMAFTLKMAAAFVPQVRIVWFGGHVITTGGAAGCTVTLKVHVA